MLKRAVQHILNRTGVSLHKRSTIEGLLRENTLLRCQLSGAGSGAAFSVAGTEGVVGSTADSELLRLHAELRDYRDRQILYVTTEDYHAHDKMRRTVNRIDEFGQADFADLSCWLFASSLNNHRVIHQRIDEGSLLWRAVKMSGGPILEVGRAAGGSTLVLLGASGARQVVSIDRAPFHAFIADQVFQRPDVARRLKLYRQSSREPIAETAFGMLFIDADHSYEGVCHDIATFWNTLQPFDGKPPLAAFHDAADNPITFVEPVKRACEELLAEKGAARVVESWGAMLVLEKTGDIDQERWYKKEHAAFWKQYANRDYRVLQPSNIQASLHPERPPIRLGTTNLLGEENVEHQSWVKHGVELDRVQLNEDNPLRLVRETRQTGEHGIEKTVPLPTSRFNFMVYLRPHHLTTIRLSVLDRDRSSLACVDFELTDRSEIGATYAKPGVEILDASFLYRNGYFGCNLAVSLPSPLASASFAAHALDPAHEAGYSGNGESGFFINLSSVREIL